MNRVYSFDLLRGLAAFAVAIPHLILLSYQSELWEGVSIIAVEVFFALSGYVLAPQVLKLQSIPSTYNYWVFMLRRWIRTVAPYLIATTLIAILTGNLLSSEFVKKALFVDTLYSLPKHDFFSISWSLAVEEWYYVIAALIAVIFRKTQLWKPFLGLALICLMIKVSGMFLDPNWITTVRRVTIYRLDAIAFGFLLYSARHYVPKGAVLPFITTILMILAVTFAIKMSSSNSVYNKAWMLLAIYLLSAFSISVVILFREIEPLILRLKLVGISSFLGKISYSVYLFHLPIGYALKELGLRPAELVVSGLVFVIIFCWLFSDLIEKRLLTKRPNYRLREARVNPNDELSVQYIVKGWIGVLTGVICLIFVYELTSYSFLKNYHSQLKQSLFHTNSDLNKMGTRNIFGAIDPLLGYAHPNRIDLDTKPYSVSQINGFGVHRGKTKTPLTIFVLGGSTSDPFIAVKKKEPPWTKYLYINCRKVTDCEVWNAGVGGFGSAQEVIRLIRDIIPVAPNIVISLHGPNELNRIERAPSVTGTQNERAKQLSKRGKLWINNWLPNTFVALAYIRRKDDTPARDQEIYYGYDYKSRTAFDNWKSNIEMMQAISHRSNVKYIVVLQPLVGWGTYKPNDEIMSAANRDKKYFDTVKEFYKKATIACKELDYCIDASLIFEGKDDNLYTDIRHPNDAGNVLIAEKVANELIERGLIHANEN